MFLLIVQLGQLFQLITWDEKKGHAVLEVLKVIQEATREAEENFEGLLIGNQGPHFCLGADLDEILEGGKNGRFEEIDLWLQDFQNTMMGLKYCRVPAVAELDPEPDLVVTNPPRTGMAKAVSAAVDRWARGRPGARVAYVSCDPATLARDVKRMPHVGLRSVVAYDLFPQTCHVETLAVLEAQ